MKLVVAASLLLITASAGAQLSYGPKIGLNVGQVTLSNEDYATSFRPGFFAGGFVNYAVNDQLSLQAEALYSLEGGNEENVAYGRKGHLNFSFVQVPVLARYKFTRGFFAEAGPQLGILVAAKEKYDGEDLNIKQYYNTTDFRVPVGVGYQFDDESKKGLTLNLRYSFSLSAINKVTVGGDKLKIQVFSLGAAIRL